MRTINEKLTDFINFATLEFEAIQERFDYISLQAIEKQPWAKGASPWEGVWDIHSLSP